MTKESQKAAVAKYLSKMADIRLHVKKELKEDIKKAADKRNMSVTAFIVDCLTTVLFDDWVEESTKKAQEKAEPQSAEKPSGWRIPLASNDKLREAGYDI
jgi:hypothetical protein